VQVDYLLASVKADSRLKDHAKIEADIAEKRAEVIGKTGLDGSFGRILCASVSVVVGTDNHIATFGSPVVDEASTLKALIEQIDMIANTTTSKGFSRPVFVGHNIGFDLRFIAQRCVVNGVTFNKGLLPFDAKAWSDDVVDTMLVWAGFGNRITLDKLCVALGVPSPKGDIDGSKVAQAFADGRFAEIVEYNRNDVSATKACYLKMKQGGMI
jgi:predicted PolB exonuclease-like 3'-5' exonuclease